MDKQESGNKLVECGVKGLDIRPFIVPERVS